MVKRIVAVLVILVLCASLGMAASQKGISIQKSKSGKISFRLKNADIKSVLHIFAKQLKVNIVAGDGVSGEATVAFSNVTPLEGLDAVLRVKGLDWSREGDTIIVSSDKQVKTFTLQFANAEELNTTIKPILSQGDSSSVNKSYNQVIVKAGSRRMRMIENTIKKMDVPQKQVVVEAHIVEIKKGDDGGIGVDLYGQRRADPNDNVQTLNFAGRNTDQNALGLYAQIISGNYQGYLSSLMIATTYNIVASPRITTINHKEATILIGEKLGYQTSTTTTTGTTTEIKFLETGTKLVLTPHVSDNGYIRMEIAPKVSEGTVDRTTGVPNESTTETKNEVLVKDGQTIVIGGLIKKKELLTETGIPILMHIPFIGMAFKRNVVSNENRELIVFIKPTILSPESLQTMQEDIQTFLKKEKNQKSNIIN